MISCAWCGVVSESEQPPLTWTSAIEHGRAAYFCEKCSRQHLRSMEGKLDSEHW